MQNIPYMKKLMSLGYDRPAYTQYLRKRDFPAKKGKKRFFKNSYSVGPIYTL